MKFLSTKILLVTALIVLASCEQSKKENLESAYAENNGIDIFHQVVNVKIDWEKKQLMGKTVIHLQTTARTDSIQLDAAGLVVESIQIGNGSALDFWMDEKRKSLIIPMDKEYRPNDEIKLTIEYITSIQNPSDPNNIWGSFGKGPRFFEPTLTEKERRKQIWAVGEPQSNRYWFPSNDDINDLRTSEIIVEVKKPLMAISNGLLISVNESENDMRFFHWEDKIPHSNHHINLIVGNYQNYKQSYGSVVINNYGYPDEVEGTKASVISLPEIMKFYAEYTGQDYPYPEYSQIFVQDFAGWKGGTMSSIITENMVDDKTTHEDFLYLWDVVEGEALAYQWFGSYLKPKNWEDVWLSKAFSRHLSSLYNIKANGNDEFLLYQHSPDLATYLGDWNSGLPTIVSPKNIDDLDDFVSGNAPYTKGALVLNMLRRTLGEEKWKTTIQKYITTFGGGVSTTNDFIQIINEVNGEPMDWFFEQWVFGTGHPKFEIEKEYDEDSKTFSLSIVQTQKTDSIVHGKKIPFFQGKIQLEMDDTIEEVYIKPERENKFSFIRRQEPRLVNFDFEDAWIKEVSFPKTNNEILGELQESKDVLHRVKQMQQLSSVGVDSLTPRSVKKEIHNSLRKIVSGNDYWRTRLMALWQLQSISSFQTTEGKIELDKATQEMLLKIVNKEKSWLKANAINYLGLTRNPEYVPIYLEALGDYSDRVVFMSAIALGRSKDTKAFEALTQLPKKPSWKNQSLISALYGLKELEDPRGYNLAMQSLLDSDNPHWNLATPIWDHRLAAAHTLVALDSTQKAYEAIKDQFEDALKQDNTNDIFYNALQVSILGDSRGTEVFQELSVRYKNDLEAMKAVTQLENQFKAANH